MKMKMTVRKRVITDGMSGITSSVRCLVDLKIGETDVQCEIGVPVELYGQFSPRTQWETDLVMLPQKV